jgi:hypothetical protein
MGEDVSSQSTSQATSAATTNLILKQCPSKKWMQSEKIN